MTDTALSPRPRRIFLLGATGTIGRATLDALLARGHEVVCFLRPRAGGDPGRGLPGAARVRVGDVTDPASLAADGFRGE
ncbi:NAD(P)H-binding protein, partial [Rhodovulum sulfidophilum]|nr:NAD(P)H-binding protein [Rhodovulum sulfidophilum]